MDKKKDGGPAFPRAASTVDEVLAVSGFNSDAQEGMTLRDYFAAHAPPMPKWWKHQAETTDLKDEGNTEAQWRWAYADAMIAERDK